MIILELTLGLLDRLLQGLDLSPKYFLGSQAMQIALNLG